MSNIKIEIGSGEYPRLIEEGFIHSDIRVPMPHQELCFDIRNLPFKDNSVDEIAVIHCLEHLSWRLEIIPTLRKLYDTLKQNGSLFIICPNLLYISKLIISLESTNIMSKWDDIMQDIYCMQDFPDNFHKSGFTPNALYSIMKNVGFKNILITEHTKEECAIHIRGYK